MIALALIAWSGFWLVVVVIGLVSGSIGLADLQDALGLLGTCLIWFGGLVWSWRRNGWAGIRTWASFRGAYLGVAVRKWQEADERAQRLESQARAASDAVEHAEAPSEEQRQRARSLADAAKEAADSAQFKRRLAGEAMQSLHKAMPDNAELADDFRALFPELAGTDDRVPPPSTTAI